MTTDQIYMSRCIQLARCGQIGAAPNPMVGALIVCHDRIIGEGYHIRCGQPHAEVNAFRCVSDESLLPHSTLYVSLEPCAHFGKTPPCARLVVEKRVKRVVVGCEDPFVKVRGKGIEIIRQAGIEVEVGVLEQECIHLNRRFFTFHTKHRPFITLKWAQTSDGLMGLRPTLAPSAPLRISTPQTMRRVHHLRATHSAILVGYNTALLDNPSLTTRHWGGPSPLRIVIDPRGQLPTSLNLFDTSAPTIVFGYKPNERTASLPNVEYCPLSATGNIYAQIFDQLYQRNIQSVLVEGGRQTLIDLMGLGLWDEMHVEHSAISAPQDTTHSATPVYAPNIGLQPKSTELLGSSTILHYVNSEQ